MNDQDNQSMLSKIKSFVDGWGFHKECINSVKDSSSKELLDEYNKCVQELEPFENIDKCKYIIELYKLCTLPEDKSKLIKKPK